MEAHKTTIDDCAVAPLEESELLPLWINDQGDLPRLIKEVTMDEQIVSGQEDAEIGVDRKSVV